MKILFCGDFHADWDAVLRMLSHHLKDGSVDGVVQAGDFGYWPNRLAGMHEVNNLLDDYDTHMLFVDGNHEDHDALAALPGPGWYGGTEVASNITWMPRGTVMEFDNGLKMGFFGGASSLDREWRTPGYDWFAKEMPTAEDLEVLQANVKKIGYPAVMISHEVPIIAGPRYDEGHHGAMFPKVDRDIADRLRKGIMMEVYNLARPGLWYYGHHHQAMMEFNVGPWNTTFIGLGMNMQPDDNWVKTQDFS